MNRELKRNMFSNQVSRRELLTFGNSSQKNDTQQMHQSHYQNSENEFSQLSGDLYNSSSSGSEQHSQNKKMFDSYVTPYGSKTSKLKNLSMKHQVVDPLSMSVPSRPNFQQQFQMNKSQMKQKEEKELMQSVVHTVRNCTEDVQNTVKAMQDNLEENMLSSNNKLTTTLTNHISQQIEKQFSLIRKSIETCQGQQETDLTEVLKEKEERIKDLQKQIEEQRSLLNSELLDKVNIMLENKGSVDSKLQKLMDNCKLQIQNQQKMMESQEDAKNLSTALHEEMQTNYEKQHCRMQTRVMENIRQIQNDLENQKDDLLNLFRKEMENITEKQTKNIGKSIHYGIEKVADLTNSSSKDLMTVHHNVLDKAMKLQEKELKLFIKSQMENQLASKIEDRKLTEELKDEITALRSKKFKDLEAVKAMDKKSEGVKKYQNEDFARTDRENKYMLQRGSGKDVASENDEQLDFHLSNNSQKFKGQDNAKRQKSINDQDLISPDMNRSKWNAKSLFTKTNPSPVATVLPQPQNKSSTDEYRRRERNKDELGRKCDYSDMRVNKNRKELNVVPQRRSQRIAGIHNESQTDSSSTFYGFDVLVPRKQELNNNMENLGYVKHDDVRSGRIPVTSDNSRTSEERNSQDTNKTTAVFHKPFNKGPSIYKMPSNIRTPAKKTFGNFQDVFEFSDENSQTQNMMKDGKQSTDYTRRMNQSEETDLTENSYKSEESRESSPSLSITKILIKRKTRRPTQSPASSVFGNLKTYSQGSRNNNRFCTPNVRDQQMSTKWLTSRTDVKNQRQEQYKRKLLQVDDELMEISHRIQSQLKRKKCN